MHVSTTSPRKPRGRPAGDGASREAILDAAGTLFGAHGYDGASMRAIAATAGVDPGMIRHFFTDKEGLFAATLTSRTNISERLAAAFHGDRSGLGERFTTAYLEMWEDQEIGTILRAIVRTALASERFAGLLHEILANRVFAELPSHTVEADDLELRMTLAGSHLFGTATLRHLAAVEPLATADRARIVAIVAPTIQRYLTEPLPTV